MLPVIEEDNALMCLMCLMCNFRQLPVDYVHPESLGRIAGGASP